MMEAGVQHASNVLWLAISAILSTLFLCGGMLVVFILFKLFVLGIISKSHTSVGEDGHTAQEKLEQSSERLHASVVEVKRALLKLKIKQSQIQNSRKSSGRM